MVQRWGINDYFGCDTVFDNKPYFRKIVKLIYDGSYTRVFDIDYKIFMIKIIREKRYMCDLVSADILFGIDTKIYYAKEEKLLVKKFLVKRYGNILMVLWEKCHLEENILVFKAIMKNFCPKWKEFLTS